MAVLYNNNSWIPERALADIAQRQGDYDDLFEYLFKCRLPLNGDLAGDERLARLVDITSTNSHYSTYQFLVQNKSDLAIALDTWSIPRFLVASMTFALVD